MNLWETIVAMAVVAVYLPAFCLAEFNTLFAREQIHVEDGMRAVEQSVTDDLLTHQSVPHEMEEGGLTYVVSIADENGISCEGTTVQVTSSASDKPDSLFVPFCQPGIFTD
ncbi:hypothetical protein AAC03nite_15960 [Alicyclobacillus acidoterrestris]|uniref:hypothetical protein n=1 Tax=Alicyclobacillus suci TaxID=2816080 RepID=UPI001193C429|nr:hypothetical protein [Alicyclobacillus suci]GEO25811.1 hypothetical protein AAC03nite_15960 [Alicyclobacillus acidoterrestris]